MAESIIQEASHVGVDSSVSGKGFVIDVVEIENFGPFKKRFQYPVSDRGLVLLRGKVVGDGEEDGDLTAAAQSDEASHIPSSSNGAGKTALLMSMVRQQYLIPMVN